MVEKHFKRQFVACACSTFGGCEPSNSIPDDLLPMVLSHLEVKERFKLCFLCRRWKSVVYKLPIAYDEDFPLEAYPIIGKLIKNFYRCRCKPLGNFQKQFIVAKCCINLESLWIDSNVNGESNWVALNTWFRHTKKLRRMAVYPPNDYSLNCYGTLFHGCDFPNLERLILWQHGPDLCQIQKEFFRDAFAETFPKLKHLTIYIYPRRFGCDYQEYDGDFNNPELQQKAIEVYHKIMDWFSEEFRQRARRNGRGFVDVFILDHGKNSFNAKGIAENVGLFPES